MWPVWRRAGVDRYTRQCHRSHVRLYRSVASHLCHQKVRDFDYYIRRWEISSALSAPFPTPPTIPPQARRRHTTVEPLQYPRFSDDDTAWSSEINLLTFNLRLQDDETMTHRNHGVVPSCRNNCRTFKLLTWITLSSNSLTCCWTSAYLLTYLLT